MVRTRAAAGTGRSPDGRARPRGPIRCLFGYIPQASPRRGGRAVQCTSLENWRAQALVGSNPTPSVLRQTHPSNPRELRRRSRSGFEPRSRSDLEDPPVLRRDDRPQGDQSHPLRSRRAPRRTRASFAEDRLEGCWRPGVRPRARVLRVFRAGETTSHSQSYGEKERRSMNGETPVRPSG